MKDAEVWFRRLATATVLAGSCAPAVAIPPYPPAQTGSKVSTYNCGNDVLTFTEIWDSSVSARRKYIARVNGKKLSSVDAQRVDQEIAQGGHFQTNSAYCTGTGFDLTLYRYTPTEAQLHFVLRGPKLTHVGLGDASTSFKLNYIPVP